MKKYLLLDTDMVLVRKVNKNPNRDLFYITAGDPIHCVFIKLGEEYYDFWGSNKRWNKPDGDNKFHEKDETLTKPEYIKCETNSWFRMRWWLIKYYKKNIGRWKSLHRRSKRMYRLFRRRNKKLYE